MIIKNKKIIEITESELYDLYFLYLERGGEIMSFPDYKWAMKRAGTKVIAK